MGFDIIEINLVIPIFKEALNKIGFDYTHFTKKYSKKNFGKIISILKEVFNRNVYV